MNVLQAMLARRSCRDFTAEPVTEKEIEQLLLAANAAPVGMARFDAIALSVIQDPALLSGIEGAACAAAPEAANKHPLYHAPAGILVSVKQEEGRTGEMHRMSAACVMENILLEAAELGLGSVYLMGVMAALSQDAALCAAAKVPAGFVPVAMAAVGHSAAELEPHPATAERSACARV